MVKISFREYQLRNVCTTQLDMLSNILALLSKETLSSKFTSRLWNAKSLIELECRFTKVVALKSKLSILRIPNPGNKFTLDF